MRTVTARAYARAGLMGNPSDGFGGRAIAITVCNFAATVTLTPADRFEILRAPADALDHPSLGAMASTLRTNGCYGGVRLIKAAILRFSRRFPDLDLDSARFTIGYDSDIPRQVGMSGSSAIITAVWRALMQWFGVGLEPAELAEEALACETAELGISAGPMDRVIQAYEGCMVMDFKPPRTAASYRRLDPALLPPLFLAWDPDVGEVSGKVHSDVRSRWERGDRDVVEAIAKFPLFADRAAACLEARDLPGFLALMNENFDTRAAIWTLSARDLELVRIGRDAGAAVKFSGSGGAVVGGMKSEADYPAIRAAYAAAGYQTIRPIITPPRASHTAGSTDK